MPELLMTEVYDPMQSSQFSASLKDGTQCVLQLCCHTGDVHDTASLKDGIRSAWCHVSPESRFYRFGYGINQLTEKQLDYLADLDNKDRLAWCAFVQGETASTGIGLARYVRLKDEPDVAEFAITVVDEYQHSGLGSLLIARLIESAKEADLKILRGYVRTGNKAMLALARKFGGIPQPEDDWLRIDIPIIPSQDPIYSHSPTESRQRSDGR